jgi:hypothetical protein
MMIKELEPIQVIAQDAMKMVMHGRVPTQVDLLNMISGRDFWADGATEEILMRHSIDYIHAYWARDALIEDGNATKSQLDDAHGLLMNQYMDIQYWYEEVMQFFEEADEGEEDD